MIVCMHNYIASFPDRFVSKITLGRLLGLVLIVSGRVYEHGLVAVFAPPCSGIRSKRAKVERIETLMHIVYVSVLTS